jgi:hypothetical protein
MDIFPEALAAAKNLNDTFAWPLNQFSFHSIYENLSVRTRRQDTSSQGANSL